MAGAVSQRELEAFRARQYAGPHAAATPQPAPAAATPTGGGGSAAAAAGALAAAALPAAQQERIEPDTGRAIIHFDADCFYAQVEEVRNPELRGRPVGVTQKYLVVTCNYAARQQGVTKLMAVPEARRRCPALVLVSGEDLSPYRAASKQILGVLQRFGTAEKLGLDEFFLDVTAEARRRLAALPGGQLPPWQGHVHSAAAQLTQDSRHRPMDLRALPAPAGSADGPPAPAAAAAAPPAPGGWEPLLRLGAAIAAEARAAVRREAGYRTSAGIACNKMLAKLCSGLHKPDDQTVLPPHEAAAFVAPLPVRALPGVGAKTERDLQALGVHTAADLRSLPRHQLVARLGERTGAFLHAACRGNDATPVQPRGPPKTVTVEDSFKSCQGFGAAEKVVHVLAPDLLARLQEELEEGGRRAATLTAKWRRRGAGASERSSASCPMPPAVLGARVPEEEQVAALAAAAIALLRRSLTEPFDLSLINIGAAAFSERPAAAGAGSIADMLAGAGRQAGSAGAAAAAAASGTAPSQQQQQQQQQPAAPAPAGSAAAAASAQQRRSYSAAPQQAPLLSKRHERQLREQGMQPPQQHDQGSGAGAAAPQYGGEAFGFEAAGDEEDDSSMWADLQGLAGWRSEGGGQRSPAAAAPAGWAGGGQGVALPAGAMPAAAAATANGSAGPPATGSSSSSGRVVILADADSFYVSVERLDDPSLVGRPVAVQQFNAGGFVAVSYEARQAGIRCGDGAGAAGRAAVPHLVRMQAASLEECRRRCPGLVVRPMRTDRYRQVADQLHALLRTFAPDGQVEKTSYDDFYLDVSAACTPATAAAGPSSGAVGGEPSPQAPMPPGLLVLRSAAPPPASQAQPPATPQQWAQLPPDLQRGVQLAAALRAAVKQRLGLTVSCGVARNKLLARLASPCGKPDGLAVVPAGGEAAFIAQAPLRLVPQLRGKFGEAVATELSARTVADLAAVPRGELVRRYGEQRGAFLAALPRAQDDAPVRERGPQKSLAAERSFPPLPTEAAAAAQLAPLARTLLARAAEDAQQHRRLPGKLVVSFRQGYGSNPRSKSAGVPPAALRWLQAAQQQAPVQQQQQPEGAEGPADAVVSAALGMLRPAVAASGWQLTRLAVSFSYEEGGGGAQQAPGQLALTACAQWGGTSKQAAAAASAEAPTEPAAAQAGAATAPAACQPAPATCAQQDSMPPQQQPPKPPAQPQRPAAKPASYRNAEALAMLQLFGGSGSGAPAGLAPADADLAPEERASLELALRLQQEEAQAAAEPAAAGGKRSAAGGAGGGKPPKQQRRGSGPMDAFLKRSGAR